MADMNQLPGNDQRFRALFDAHAQSIEREEVHGAE